MRARGLYHTSREAAKGPLAATAEFFASESGIGRPAWVDGPDRFVEPWWFVASRPAFHAYTLANTPAVFARHGIFIAREAFARV